MQTGCLPICGMFVKTPRRRKCPSEGMVRSNTTGSPITSSLSGLTRGKGVLASTSLMSTSSTISSRSNVSFNPRIESVVFDTSEAPSQIQQSPITKSRCSATVPRPLLPMKSNSFLVPVSSLPRRTRIERRHLLS